MTARRDIDELLAARLAAGLTVRDAAAELGVSEKTAHRRLADPAFRQRITELRREMTARAIGQLADGMTHAVDELRRLASSANEGIRLRACIALLEHGLKAAALADLEDRIRSIESRLAHANAASPPEHDRGPTG